MKPFQRWIALGLLAFATPACEPTVAPESRARLDVDVRYALQLETGPITKIRITAFGPGTVVVGAKVFDVPPDAPSWNVALEIDTRTAIDVTLAVELVSVGPDGEMVEWSGRAGPFAVVPGKVNEASVVQLGVGPADNAAVTAVQIVEPVPALLEGDQTQLGVIVTGGGPNAQAVWTSLDSRIANVSSRGRLEALLPGSARVVAAAGSRADTVTVEVRQRATRVALTPAAAELVSFGAEAAFSARVLDVRGADVTGARIVWSTSNSTIASSLGGGRFRALSNGTVTVTAAMEGATTLQATATLAVAQRVATLRTSPDTARVAVNGKTTIAAEAKDALGNAVGNAAVTWSSSDPSVATVDNSGVVTGVKAGSATITATARVGGSAPATDVVTGRSLVIVSAGTPVIPDIQGTYDFSGPFNGSAETISGFFTISEQQGSNAKLTMTLVFNEPGFPPQVIPNIGGTVIVDANGNISGRASDPNGVFTFEGRFVNGVITATWIGDPTDPADPTFTGSLTATRR